MCTLFHSFTLSLFQVHPSAGDKIRGYLELLHGSGGLSRVAKADWSRGHSKQGRTLNRGNSGNSSSGVGGGGGEEGEEGGGGAHLGRGGEPMR
jgi:hypothetical protein